MQEYQSKAYQPGRGNDEGSISMKVEHKEGDVSFWGNYKSGTNTESMYKRIDGDTFYYTKILNYDGHMDTTSASRVAATATCARIPGDEAVQLCKRISPHSIDCDTFKKDNVFLCSGVTSVDGRQTPNPSQYNRLTTIPTMNDMQQHVSLSWVDSGSILHEQVSTPLS